jgi:hypothetical protein
MKTMALLSVHPAGHTMTRAAILPLVVRDLCYEIGGNVCLIASRSVPMRGHVL